ncbi:MAG: TerB family tellurite resistance protein [Bacteroidia bacterium]
MRSKVKLYDVFGELLYVVAMADGIIQPEEKKKLEELVADHPWGEEIKWSFDYEVKQNPDVEDLYKKVILFCQDFGPDPEYQFMIEVMEKVAEASAGIDKDEREVVHNFVTSLTARFRKDIEKINHSNLE